MRARLFALVCAISLAIGAEARAQSIPGGHGASSIDYVGGMPPVMDQDILVHAMLEQFEDRLNGSDHAFRYDGQAWIGTDYDKFWVKSEGRLSDGGRFTDGQHEALYDRAISTFFDLQTGIRVDADGAAPRSWGAFGIQGLAPYFFDVEATAYVSGQGHLAARLKGSYDLLLTQQLILQPEAELNLYSKADPGRRIGSGFSDIDAGLRLRYELSRKLAPYLGIVYEGRFGQSARYAQTDGESTSDLRFVFGLRTWF
jgi:copper resistance protein B